MNWKQIFCFHIKVMVSLVPGLTPSFLSSCFLRTALSSSSPTTKIRWSKPVRRRPTAASSRETTPFTESPLRLQRRRKNGSKASSEWRFHCCSWSTESRRCLTACPCFLLQSCHQQRPVLWDAGCSEKESLHPERLVDVQRTNLRGPDPAAALTLVQRTQLSEAPATIFWADVLSATTRAYKQNCFNGSRQICWNNHPCF